MKSSLENYKRFPGYVDLVLNAIRTGDQERLNAAVAQFKEALRIKGESDEINYQFMVDVFGNTIFHAAAQSGNIIMFDEMVARYDFRGALPLTKEQFIRDVNNLRGQTLLFPAIRSGNFEMVKKLVEKHGLDVTIQDYPDSEFSFRNRESLLTVAAECGNCDIFRFLKGRGATDENKNNDASAIVRAVKGGKVEMVKMLVEEYGYNLRYSSSKDGSLLYMARNHKLLCAANPYSSQSQIKQKQADYDKIIVFLKARGVELISPYGEYAQIRSFVSTTSLGGDKSPSIQEETEADIFNERDHLSLDRPSSHPADVITSHHDIVGGGSKSEESSTETFHSHNTTPTHQDEDQLLQGDVAKESPKISEEDERRYQQKLDRIMTFAFYKLRTLDVSGNAKTVLRKNIREELKKNEQFRNCVLDPSFSVMAERGLGALLISTLADKGIISKGCLFTNINKSNIDPEMIDGFVSQAVVQLRSGNRHLVARTERDDV